MTGLRRRLDPALTALVALTTVVVGVATLSANPQFSDSSESIMGIRTLGILHAPGYPIYVLAGRLFTIIEPFGSLALRVNLFSLACAATAAALLYRAIRRLGADPVGAAVGALAFATGQTIWFYSTYAKAYAPTTAILAAVLLLCLRWKDGGSDINLLAAGGLTAAAVGFSYQPVLLLVPGLLVLLFARPPRPRLRLVAWTALGAVGVLALALGYTVIRAAQDPAWNWGDPSSLSRLTSMLRLHGFVFRGSGSGGLGAAATGPGTRGFAEKIVRFPWFVIAEVGIVATALAVIGLVRSWFTSLDRAAALALMFIVNALGIIVVVQQEAAFVTFRVTRGNLLRSGGFYIGAFLVAACWVGIGASAVIRDLPAAVARRRWRWAGSPLPAVVAAILVIGLLGASAGRRYEAASHRSAPYARDYTNNVMAALPRHAVLLSWVAERSFPIDEARLVDHRRTDVAVVQMEFLSEPWYQRQVARRLGVHVPGRGSVFDRALRLATDLRRTRPVYADYAGLVQLLAVDKQLGFQRKALVAVLTGTPGQQPIDADADGALYRRVLATRGLTGGVHLRLFPNGVMLLPYSLAAIDYGTALFERGDLTGAEQAYQLAATINPLSSVAARDLEIVRKRIRG